MKQILLSGLLLVLTLALSLGALSYFPLTENVPPSEGPSSDVAPSPPPSTPPQDPPEAPEATPIYTELGIPAKEKYPTGDTARCPWDMTFYQGKLYLGSGHYVTNKGPAEIYTYDPQTGAIEKSGTLPDEEVSRFVQLGGRLAVPGSDSTEIWSSDAPFSGSYYLLEGDTWVQKQVLFGAIHNFDLIAYGGLIFAGLGVVPGNSPIAVSADGGESFSPISLYKGDAPIDTSGFQLVRTHDFLLCGDTLYATLYADYPDKAQGTVYELYVYDPDNARFCFVESIQGIVERIAYNHALIGEKLMFDGQLFFNTGYLYETASMALLKQSGLPDAKIVADLTVSSGTLYLLGAAKDKESGRFRTTVYKRGAGEARATLLFDFLYDVPPMSLAVSGKDFYIGMGDGNNAHEKNGAILQVTLPDLP